MASLNQIYNDVNWLSSHRINTLNSISYNEGGGGKVKYIKLIGMQKNVGNGCCQISFIASHASDFGSIAPRNQIVSFSTRNNNRAPKVCSLTGNENDKKWLTTEDDNNIWLWYKCSDWQSEVKIHVLAQYGDIQLKLDGNYGVSNTEPANAVYESDNSLVTDYIHGNKVYNAVWNDYAELFERGEQTEAGDIIALDTLSPTEQYIKADSSSKRVIGVHSDTYGHLIGGEQLENFEDNLKKFIPIGLAGRVNVKVKGKVELGDYIVPSDEKGIGRAYNKDTDDRDLIIGYLVEADEHEDVRHLKMFINKK